MGRLDGLPAGTVAVHVRTSVDKTTNESWMGKPEMDRLSFDTYMEKVHMLVAGERGVRVLHENYSDTAQCFRYMPSAFARRLLFFNTEDEVEVRRAMSLAEGKSSQAWDVSFCTANRTNEGIITRKRKFGIRNIVIESLLNLELFLEADAWICTLASAWCAIIDELRMTVGGKASAPFIDLAFKRPTRYHRGCPEGMPLCYSGW
ncbi:unnamed protein product [Prorocentrum cordatum]|uniref:Uncharacterized protein n=1 Tax=Prorocentrum cordatum TaxID=2364126 RepID=A0ABN9VQL4_9DINO|nr:unnamed protein product [Polarella glacialis]